MACRRPIVGMRPRGIALAASRVLERLVLVFCLGKGGVGAGTGAPGDGRCDCFEAFGEVCDGTAGGGFDCFCETSAVYVGHRAEEVRTVPGCGAVRVSAGSCVCGQSRGIEWTVLSFGLRGRLGVSLMGMMVWAWLVMA